jgi:TetR/AcrR family transcriptional repressor of mexJK operon
MAQDQKQAAIIEAAIKRFAHFGVAKTTMSEIAADLSLSKASLYYYFPDKLNLYAEVLKSVTNAEQNDAEIIAKEADPIKAILAFLERRTEFIIKYHNILEFLKTFQPSNLPKELEPVFSHLRQRELNRIIAIIEKGVKTGKLEQTDAKKTAELYFDFLDGFRYSELSRIPHFFPDKKQFQAILKKEKAFSIIFFKGLSF